MDLNEKFVITISREIGSGGRTVGRKLSEKLGVPYCDKNVIRGLIEHFNLSAYNIEKIKGEKKNWLSDFVQKVAPVPPAGSFLETESRYATEYPEAVTTENIFKSNIETISTIGNILFVETVSAFYDYRNKYKNDVADAFLQEGETSIQSYEGLSEFNAPSISYMGELHYLAMKRNFEQCKMLMKVSEEDMDVFSKERKRVEEPIHDESMVEMTKVFEERHQREAALQKAREEGRKALGKD